MELTYIEVGGLTQVTAGHLGGYVLGGDPWTQCPELWTWLVHVRGVKSVIDIGCGEGQALDAFTALGIEAVGIEGIPQPHPRIICHDYTTGPYYPSRRYDLGWSCEFVEHVEQQYEDNFLATFKACDLLLITHAVPGAGGHHHVNCQPQDYWLNRLAPWFTFDPDLTQFTRSLCTGRGPNHFANSGLALICKASTLAEPIFCT